jgi:hypothetical protein
MRTAIVQLNAESSYGNYIDFNYVMQLYSRGARVVNEAQPRHTWHFIYEQLQVFGAVIIYTARRMISEVVVWVSADPMYGILSML